jgi:hypothetical protein
VADHFAADFSPGTRTNGIHAGNKFRIANIMATPSPHSPSRCRRAGCRVQRINTQVKSKSTPPPTTLRTNQPPGVVQIQLMALPRPTYLFWDTLGFSFLSYPKNIESRTRNFEFRGALS